MLLGEDLDFIQGFLNSKISYFYFNIICTSSGMNTNQWNKSSLEKLPIPIRMNQVQKRKIENFVKKINKNKGDITDLTNQIDKIFYEYFDLTKGEIQNIENE